MGLMASHLSSSQWKLRQAETPDMIMFGIMKRAKPPAFAEVLDEISNPPSAAPDEAQAQLEITIAPSQVQQPHDWLLQLLSGMVPGDARGGGHPGIDAAAVSSSYLEDNISLEDAIAPLLEAIASCEQDAIAEELGLHDRMSVNELQRIRRLFARDNHPDRFAPHQRELATHRMTIANMLIDRQLRQKALAKKSSS